MKIINLAILLALMSAFAIGVSLQESDWEPIEEALNNATSVITNITLNNTNHSDQNVKSITLIIEKFIHFIGVLLFESMRIGIQFGYDNPQYFEPLFIINIVKLIIWLAIISLLIKPVGYLIILIIIFVLWIKEIITKARKKKPINNDTSTQTLTHKTKQN